MKLAQKLVGNKAAAAAAAAGASKDLGALQKQQLPAGLSTALAAKGAGGTGPTGAGLDLGALQKQLPAALEAAKGIDLEALQKKMPAAAVEAAKGVDLGAPAATAPAATPAAETAPAIAAAPPKPSGAPVRIFLTREHDAAAEAAEAAGEAAKAAAEGAGEGAAAGKTAAGAASEAAETLDTSALAASAMERHTKYMRLLGIVFFVGYLILAYANVWRQEERAIREAFGKRSPAAAAQAAAVRVERGVRAANVEVAPPYDVRALSFMGLRILLTTYFQVAALALFLFLVHFLVFMGDDDSVFDYYKPLLAMLKHWVLYGAVLASAFIQTWLYVRSIQYSKDLHDVRTVVREKNNVLLILLLTTLMLMGRHAWAASAAKAAVVAS
jgi:hypothetical protein